MSRSLGREPSIDQGSPSPQSMLRAPTPQPGDRAPAADWQPGSGPARNARSAAQQIGQVRLRGEASTLLAEAGAGGVIARAMAAADEQPFTRTAALAVPQQAERLEAAITAGQRVVLERFSDTANHGEEPKEPISVWSFSCCFTTSVGTSLTRGMPWGATTA